MNHRENHWFPKSFGKPGPVKIAQKKAIFDRKWDLKILEFNSD